LAAAALLLDAPQMLACVLLTMMMMMMMMMQASRGAAASPTETVITLTGPKDFAGVSGAPLAPASQVQRSRPLRPSARS